MSERTRAGHRGVAGGDRTPGGHPAAAADSSPLSMAEWPGVATGSADERPLRRPVARPERAVLGGRADHRVAPPVPRPALPRRHRRHPPAVTAWPRHCERPSRGAAAGTDPPGRHLPRPFLGRRTAGGTAAPTAPGRTRGRTRHRPTAGPAARSTRPPTGGPTAPTPVTTTTSRTAGPCPSHLGATSAAPPSRTAGPPGPTDAPPTSEGRPGGRLAPRPARLRAVRRPPPAARPQRAGSGVPGRTPVSPRPGPTPAGCPSRTTHRVDAARRSDRPPATNGTPATGTANWTHP